jgi:hypothetical protein
MATEAKRPQLEKLLGADGFPPLGTLKYPRLNEPDTKFKAEGVFTTKLIVAGEFATAIIEKLTAVANTKLEAERGILTKEVEVAKGDKKGKAKKQLAELKLSDMPFKPVFDEDGNETGDYEFTFKMNAQWTDKKTNKVTKQFPKVFDAKGKALSPIPNIWGGTKARVASQIMPFYTALAGAGVSLRLTAVQIIELQSGNGGNAESYGFGEEEGFEGSSQPHPTDAAETSTDATSDTASGADEEQF